MNILQGPHQNLAQLSLCDVLSSPDTLSYFKVFMDRRQRALLVQFCLTVVTFKDPLESMDSEPGTEDSDRPLASSTVKEDVG
jgi:sorting nexin-25